MRVLTRMIKTMLQNKKDESTDQNDPDNVAE